MKKLIFAPLILLAILLIISKTSVAFASDDPAEFIIPYANIIVDGNDADWQGISPAISDPIGDKIGARSGTDISNVYLAHDDTYLYVKIDLADGPPNPNWTFYSLFLDSNPDNPQIGDQYLLSHFTGTAWPTYLKQWISFTPPDAITVYQDIASPDSSFLEMRMPLSYLIKDPFIFYAYSQTDPAGPYFDRTLKIEAKLAQTLNEAAANLAKQLVNSAYLVGGKGWDYNQNEFVSPDVIKTGYNFWNQTSHSVTFGAGVDCSGLIMWAYDRSFDSNKSHFNNFVKAEGADEQFDNNTAPTTEVQLRSGDVMFFDWGKWHENTQSWDEIKDNYIDHVAMYVGESGGYDVVNARSRELGIRGMSKDILKELPGFVAFKQVVSALPPHILASVNSPVDLIVTDPDGFTITPTTIIPSELEFLRQIPGVLYYSEMEKGADGRPIDQVYSYAAKTGNYLITVLPEPDALSTDTYTLEVKTLINGEIVTTVLAENVPISEIPEQPYLIKVTETEVILATPMKSFTAKEMEIRWTPDYSGKHRKGKTTFTISGSFELPDEYQKADLDKLAFLSIQIADKLGKDKVIFKELKNLWLYQEPRKKADDSLGQGIDIKTAVINWIEEKECKFFSWGCKEKFKKNWFYIRGELSLKGIDVNTLPREATLILEIPTVSNEKASILAGIETIEFKKIHHTWLYRLSAQWKGWQDGWWKKWDND